MESEKTPQEIKDAAMLTPKEIYWVNQQSKKIFMSDQRNYAIMALCCALIENLCIQTTIKKEVMVELIKGGINDK